MRARLAEEIGKTGSTTCWLLRFRINMSTLTPKKGSDFQETIDSDLVYHGLSGKSRGIKIQWFVMVCYHFPEFTHSYCHNWGPISKVAGSKSLS